MVRLALTDLRRGVAILPAEPAPVGGPVPPALLLAAQPPGTNPVEPAGVARMSDGRIVIADRRGHRIVAMHEDGTGWATFGAAGPGAGQLRSPGGVAVGPGDRIFVADTGNHRIVSVDSMAADGWQTYGSAGGPTEADAGVGRFAEPVALVVGAGGVVVADPGAGRVVRLSGHDLSGLDDAGWDATPPGALSGPVGLAVLPGGDIVVADLLARRLAFLAAPSAGVIGSVTDPWLAGPTAVAAFGKDSLVVCVGPLTALMRVTRTDGTWTVTLDRHLDRLGLRRPGALCLLP